MARSVSARHDHHDDHHDDEEDAHHHGLAPGAEAARVAAGSYLPLILLAIPSLLIGYFTNRADAVWRVLQERDFVGENHHAMAELHENFGGAKAMGMHAISTVCRSGWRFGRCGGVVVLLHEASGYSGGNPAQSCGAVHTSCWKTSITRRYLFCDVCQGFAWSGLHAVEGRRCALIDGRGQRPAKLVGAFARLVRFLQSGYVYHYAVMQ